MKYVLLCGGIGTRYNKYSLPKPLNYIHGKHMIEYTIENIPSYEIYIIYNALLNEYNFREIVKNKCKKKTFHFSCIEYTTRGAVESAYIGMQHFNIENNENVVFIDNDNLHSLENISGKFDSHFIGYGIDKTEKSNYSFIEISSENGKVKNIEEKKKISDFFCCGLYGFYNKETFIKHAETLLLNNNKTNNEFYFSQLYKSILSTETILPVHITKTQHIGSYHEITDNLSVIPKSKLRICFDLDNTLVTNPTIVGDYTTVKPIIKNIHLLNMFKEGGHEIIIYTARRMQTHNNNIGKVIKDIALTTINTLEQFEIRYDELIFGKPNADIYIDDRALNPYINDISQFGFFIKTDEYLPNKLETNKFNTISFIENQIIKTGPKQFINGELFYYENIPLEISPFFPKLLGYKEVDEKTMKLEMEYVKGLPLFYLYKNKLITPKIMDNLFDILNIIHTQKQNITISDKDVRDNYFEKIKKRFENKKDYPFQDADDVYNEILEKLDKNYSADIVPIIHGDFWFSNIIMQYDDNFKLIDMKGQVNGVFTINGDRYYDYGKLYQSVIGYDLILNNVLPDEEYMLKMHGYFIQKCNENGLNIPYLKQVTKSLLFGNFSFIDKPDETKQNIWNLLKFIH